MTEWTPTGGWPDREELGDGKCNECDGEGINDAGEVCDYCGGTGEQ